MQEVAPDVVHEIEPQSTFKESGLQHGDIICFQEVISDYEFVYYELHKIYTLNAMDRSQTLQAMGCQFNVAGYYAFLLGTMHHDLAPPATDTLMSRGIDFTSRLQSLSRSQSSPLPVPPTVPSRRPSSPLPARQTLPIPTARSAAPPKAQVCHGQLLDFAPEKDVLSYIRVQVSYFTPSQIMYDFY